MTINPRRAKGITLIELMIVVVIVGILAAIAFPSYTENVNSGRRADGQGALVNTAQRLERCFTQFNTYAGACGVAFPIASPEGFYQITAPVRTATTFTLVATPQGPQANDTRCGNLSLTHTGVRAATGTNPDRCW
ncbi:MAG: type IV pilin protein [Gammaproteobacteria bacterium]|nr:type IV pilin protein [Gammaproteobacteria bacterium]